VKTSQSGHAFARSISNLRLQSVMRLIFILAISVFTSTAYADTLAPALSLQGNTLTLTWPTNQPLLGAEYTTSLLVTNWIRLTNASIVNGRFTVNDTTTNTSRFYRLKCGYDAPPVPVVSFMSVDYPAGSPVFVSGTGAGTECTIENSSPICTIPASPLDASLDLTFDASQSIDPRSCTNGSLAFHWEIFKPVTQGGERHTPRSITGYHSPILHLAPNSLPNLIDVDGDQFSTSWRVLLTITHQPFDPNATPSQSTIVWFRFRHLGSQLTLDMSTTCQSQTTACPTCPCTIANALPTLETP
jgi:hypothetical protein